VFDRRDDDGRRGAVVSPPASLHFGLSLGRRTPLVSNLFVPADLARGDAPRAGELARRCASRKPQNTFIATVRGTDPIKSRLWARCPGRDLDTAAVGDRSV